MIYGLKLKLQIQMLHSHGYVSSRFFFTYMSTSGGGRSRSGGRLPCVYVPLSKQRNGSDAMWPLVLHHLSVPRWAQLALPLPRCRAGWSQHLKQKVMNENQSKLIECPQAGCHLLTDQMLVSRILKQTGETGLCTSSTLRYELRTEVYERYTRLIAEAFVEVGAPHARKTPLLFDSFPIPLYIPPIFHHPPPLPPQIAALPVSARSSNSHFLLTIPPAPALPSGFA